MKFCINFFAGNYDNFNFIGRYWLGKWYIVNALKFRPGEMFQPLQKLAYISIVIPSLCSYSGTS